MNKVIINNEQSLIKLLTYTWPKDSHGLFDYESKQHYRSEFIVQEDSKIFRQNNKLYMLKGKLPDKDIPTTELNYLFDLKKINTENLNDQNKYILESSKQFENHYKTNTDNNIYHVVRGMKKNGAQTGFKLKVSDVIKLGRVKFIVKEIYSTNNGLTKLDDSIIVDINSQDSTITTTLESKDQVNYTNNSIDTTTFLQNNTQTNLLMDIEDLNGNDHSLKKTEIEETKTERPMFQSENIKVCNFCLCDETEGDPNLLDDRMINICKCKGSCQFTHLKCFKKWVEYKTSEIQKFRLVLPNVIAYNLKKLHCELCHQLFPLSIKVKDQTLEIPIEKPKNVSYIILERMESVKDCRALYVLDAFNIQEFQIGRAYTSHILINDISVSRIHSLIKYIEGDFYIFDHNSKFGTLVLLQGPLEITKNTAFLQCGKTVVTVAEKPIISKAIETVNLEHPESHESINTSSTIEATNIEHIESQELINTPSASSTQNDEDIKEISPIGANTINPNTTTKRQRGRPKKVINKPLPSNTETEIISELVIPQICYKIDNNGNITTPARAGVSSINDTKEIIRGVEEEFDSVNTKSILLNSKKISKRNTKRKSTN